MPHMGMKGFCDIKTRRQLDRPSGQHVRFARSDNAMM